MSKITGYAKQPDPKWLYILIAAVLIMFFLLFIYLVGAIAKWKEDRRLYLSTSTTTTTLLAAVMPTEEASSPVPTTSIVPSSKIAPTSTTLIEPKKEEKKEANVEKITITTNVDEKNLPTDVLEKIRLEKGKVFCYTRIYSPDVPQTFRHVWITPKKQVVADVKLILRNQPADTWSYINLLSGGKGEWKVKVKNLAGEVLSEVRFIVY